MEWRVSLLVYACLFLLAPGPLFGQSPLIINEIMANPSGGQLASVEWIELYNPSNRTVSLSEYALQYRSGNERDFPLPNLFLGAKQYAIVCAATNAPLLELYGNVVPLASWPTLNNTGENLFLTHRDQGVIDHVPYSNRWYTTAQKRDGGWSLERINPYLPCHMATNWQESNALRGGTPGRRNSVYDSGRRPDLHIVSQFVENDEIYVVFNRQIAELLSLESVYISLDAEQIPLKVLSVKGDTLMLSPNVKLQPHIAYNVTVKGSYCDQDVDVEHLLFESREAVFNDVVINEVLFNPKPGGVDFVELFNRSDKIYNLQGWRIGNRVLASEPWLLGKNEYVVITTDKDVLGHHYPKAVLGHCIVLPSMPAYANERGMVTIFDQSLTMVDSLYYTSSMHQPFLSNPRGVSLERQSFDRETNESGNFVSAATASEGATPGYLNSKQQAEKSSSNKVFIHNKVVSPDGDGKDDLLQITYEISDQNVMLNLHIYDDKGRLIKQVIRNQSIGFSGEIGWDGKAENNADCVSGNYIMWAEIYNDQGVRQIFKEAFVLVRDATYF